LPPVTMRHERSVMCCGESVRAIAVHAPGQSPDPFEFPTPLNFQLRNLGIFLTPPAR
jgi:hypothetical protein